MKLTAAMLDSLEPATNARGWYEITDDGLRCDGTHCRLKIVVGGPREDEPPKKTWVLYYRPNRTGARRRNKKFGHYPAIKLKEARSKAARWGVECREGRDPFAQGRRARGSSYRFESLFEDYFAHISKPADPKADPPVPRILTWEHRRRLIELYALPHWRDFDVREITTEMALDLLAEIRFRPDGRETTMTADKVRSHLGQMFKHWKQRRIVTLNPIRAIECFRQNRSREIYLEPEEVRQLWTFLEEQICAGTLTQSIRASAFQFALLTGMRFGEVATSRWSELDDERTWLTVPPHRFHDGQRIPRSNKARRTMNVYLGSPLGRSVVARLESLRDVMVEEWSLDQPLEWIFPTTTTRRWLRTFGSKEKARYRRATGLPDLGWHVLRHTFATLAEGELHLDAMDIGRAMNHAPETVVRAGAAPRMPKATGKYIHPTQKRIRAKVKPVFEAWHAYLSDLVEAPETLPARRA